MRVTLNDVIRVHYGKSLKAEDRDESGASPVYGSNGVIGRHNSKLIDYPTLIIGRKGSVGAVTFAPDGGWPIDTTFYTEIVKPGEVDLKYLYYAIHNADLERHTITTSIPGLSREDIYKTKIYLPPLAEQRRIAAILDTADALREKRRQIIAKYDTLLRAVFLEMFGDPVRNPKGWQMSSFGQEVSLLEYGPRFYNESYSQSGTRIVRITDLDSLGNLDFGSMPRMEISSEERMKYCLNPGDLIFARSGATVGKTALISDGDPECIAGAYFIRMRFKDTVRPLYARMVIASKSVQAIITNRSRQSAQQNFSGPGIRSLPLPVPPMELQLKLQNLHSTLCILMSKSKLHLQLADKLFNALQHRAFTGKLSTEKASAAHHEFSAD